VLTYQGSTCPGAQEAAAAVAEGAETATAKQAVAFFMGSQAAAQSALVKQINDLKAQLKAVNKKAKRDALLGDRRLAGARRLAYLPGSGTSDDDIIVAGVTADQASLAADQAQAEAKEAAWVGNDKI
jgi:hypothetical protein